MSANTSRADVFSNVPEASGYQVAYELAIPLNAAFQGASTIPYNLDHSTTAAPGGFDRVAYYLELTSASGTSWAYASMDAFTGSIVETGLPHDVENPISHQRSVSNLTVQSNVGGVETGTFDRGQIEMWHHTYTAANAASVFAASNTTNDWGDTIGGTASGYGSFQIHNPFAKQVVMAYNRWATAGAVDDDVGIGNSGGTHPDWTQTANSASYTQRKLVILVRPRNFNINFTSFPKNLQVTPRNPSTNLATVSISGTETIGGHDKAVLRIFRNGLPFGSDLEQALAYSGGGAEFSFNPQIPAELASYTFELFLKQGETLRLVRSVRDVTAGDVYLWYGQSNGEARMFSGSSDAYLSPWVRTFGMSSDSAAFTQNSSFWIEADGDGYMDVPAGIGQWPLVIGRWIVDTYGIPVAILNGSRAAYNITRLQRDDANPDNLSDTGSTTYRVYNRLRYRAIQSAAADKIRGIFFYQGESDQNNASQHAGGFASLMADWPVDYPGVEKIFVSQVHVGCTSSAPVTRELPELRNVQRLFGDVYDKVRVMSTNGLATHTDNCHFAFTGGYETHGQNVFRQVQRDLYGALDAPATDPPNPANVELISGNRLRIHLRKLNSGIVIDPAALADFRLNGSSAVLLSAAVTTSSIDLQYDRPLADADSLDYLAHIGNSPGWIRNSNGVGMLAFTEPITRMQVTRVSPTAAGVYTPGTPLTLHATADSPGGDITRMEVIINGLLHAAENGVDSIQCQWTVPPSGTWHIIYRAIDSSGQTMDATAVVFTQENTTPGGVTAGLNVWLKPESGVVHDATGAVSTWLDSSGNNHHCVQTSPASQPSFQSNQFGIMPGLVFDGGDWLTASSGMSIGSYTKIVRVSMPEFSTTLSGNILSSAATSGIRHALFMNKSTKPSLWHSAIFATSATSMTANTQHILSATYDSATKAGTMYLDGSLVGSGTAANNHADPTYQLGNLGGLSATTMRGSIGEVLIYNRVLTPTERTNVETYLTEKSSTPPNAPLVEYQSWALENIPAPADNSPTADANHNGLVNLVEFALGSDNPQALRIEASSGIVTIRYSRPTNRTGISYQLLQSSDMLNWTPIADSAGPASNGIEERIHSQSQSLHQKQIYQLQIKLQP